VPDNRPGQPPRRDDDDLDVHAEVRDLVEAMREKMFGGTGGGGGGGRASGARPLPSISPWPIVLIALALYLGSGFFIVAPDQRGVVLRFGQVVREVGPGPGYHLPWPFEQVLRPSVTAIRKEEFGFRTVDVGPPARYRDVDPEALMLTGDENIVKLLFIVQYKVKADPESTADFLFNVRDPTETVRAASEAAMRQVIGSNKIDDVLTEDRERIQIETQKLLQEILDGYDSGLKVETVKLQDVDPPDQVSDAFKDVINAQQDRERLINEARGYANDVVPKARGQAAQLLNEAEGYRLSKIQEAQGAGQRFVALYDEYLKAKDVTRERLYIEAMEDILPRIQKIVLDDKAGDHTVPYLPLDQMLRPRAAQSAAEPEPRR
jgi:membrane protease subunit HflK